MPPLKETISLIQFTSSQTNPLTISLAINSYNKVAYSIEHKKNYQDL